MTIPGNKVVKTIRALLAPLGRFSVSRHRTFLGELVFFKAVALFISEQVRLDGSALLHDSQQRTKSGQPDFNNDRGAEVSRGAQNSKEFLEANRLAPQFFTRCRALPFATVLAFISMAWRQPICCG